MRTLISVAVLDQRNMWSFLGEEVLSILPCKCFYVALSALGVLHSSMHHSDEARLWSDYAYGISVAWRVLRLR